MTLITVGVVAGGGLFVVAVNFHHFGVKDDAVTDDELDGCHHTELLLGVVGCHHGLAVVVVDAVVESVGVVGVVDGVDGVKL